MRQGEIYWSFPESGDGVSVFICVMEGKGRSDYREETGLGVSSEGQATRSIIQAGVGTGSEQG